MMEHLKTRIAEIKHRDLIPFVFIPLAYWESLDFFFFVATMLFCISAVQMAVQIRKEEHRWTYLVQNITMCLMFVYYMVAGLPIGMILGYSAAVTCWYATKHRNRLGQIILAAYLSQIIMNAFVNPESTRELPYTVLITAYNLCFILLLSSVFNFKTAVSIHFTFQTLLRTLNFYYGTYRYAAIGILDIFSIPTFLTIAEQYQFQPNRTILLYLGICIVCLILMLCTENFKIKGIRFFRIGTLVLSSILFLMIGERAYQDWQNPKERSMYFFDAFAMSAVEQLNTILDCPDRESQETRVHAFAEDIPNPEDIQPNIITVMSESYADLVKILDLDVNEDPLAGLYAMDNDHTAHGFVHVNTVGGGTSISEWEYLTGLNCVDFSVYRVPFIMDMQKNYAFTSSLMYTPYRKVFMHPFRTTGWNRPNVYQALNYDEILFEKDFKNLDDNDRVRKYVSDDTLTDEIISLMERTKEPLFSMNVTMQNHGDYLPESGDVTRNIKFQSDMEMTEEEQDKLELFLNLQKLSTDALVKLVDYLEAHPENPTILVFFGDHYPSGIVAPQKGVSYDTPYFVYCNYKPIQDMPENMDLSLLYPNMKRAAGLPLTSWEKYLLSLNGATADRDMILARIRYGGF